MERWRERAKARFLLPWNPLWNATEFLHPSEQNIQLRNSRWERTSDHLGQGSVNFFVKGQIINILDYAGHKVLAATTQMSESRYR